MHLTLELLTSEYFYPFSAFGERLGGLLVYTGGGGGWCVHWLVEVPQGVKRISISVQLEKRSSRDLACVNRLACSSLDEASTLLTLR